MFFRLAARTSGGGAAVVRGSRGLDRCVRRVSRRAKAIMHWDSVERKEEEEEEEEGWSN